MRRFLRLSPAERLAWLDDVAHGVRPVDYPALREHLRALGPGGINKLDAKENARLAETPYIEETVALVLQGCKRAFAGRFGLLRARSGRRADSGLR